MSIQLQEVGRSPDHVALRCCETGIVYSVESNEFGEYVIRNSGVEIGRRDKRPDALEFLRQQAALDFRTAQAETGAYSA